MCECMHVHMSQPSCNRYKGMHMHAYTYRPLHDVLYIVHGTPCTSYLNAEHSIIHTQTYIYQINI